jgi:hypothetical protein
MVHDNAHVADRWGANRSCASQWPILTNRRATKSTTKCTLNSSRKMVMARHVSMMASRARSCMRCGVDVRLGFGMRAGREGGSICRAAACTCSRSTSDSRSVPRKMRFMSFPTSSVTAKIRFPRMAMLSLDVDRYSMAG